MRHCPNRYNITRLNDLIAGDDATVLSLEHIEAGAPRTLIFHGEDEFKVPITERGILREDGYCWESLRATPLCRRRAWFFYVERADFEPVLMKTIRFVRPELEE